MIDIGGDLHYFACLDVSLALGCRKKNDKDMIIGITLKKSEQIWVNGNRIRKLDQAQV